MTRWIEFTVRVPFYGRILIEDEMTTQDLMEKIERVVQIRARSHALNFNHAEFKIRQMETIPLKGNKGFLSE